MRDYLLFIVKNALRSKRRTLLTMASVGPADDLGACERWVCHYHGDDCFILPPSKR